MEMISAIHTLNRLNRPVISFTFDDVPRSAITVGADILGKHGLQGTYYVCMGLAHAIDAAGEHFGPDDLGWLAANGHEIGCHTFGHLSLRDHSAEDIAADLDRNHSALQKVLPGFTPRQFAYPYGHISIETWRLVKTRFETCRGTLSGIHSVRERFDRLFANSLYETVPVARNLRLIDQVLGNGGWLIFYTHDIATLPSSFGCTPHYFETVVSKAAASGAEVLKIGEAAKRLRAIE
jgi:peptidoglycan/xylan/chitin deacetylase (PgdA/CDA1 family)